MLGLIQRCLRSLVALFRPRAEMAAENLALRHQLGILLRSRPARLLLTSWDRALWAFVLHRFPAWRVWYKEDRLHLALEKDAPDHRPVEPPEMGEAISLARLGGLHHRYSRRAG